VAVRHPAPRLRRRSPRRHPALASPQRNPSSTAAGFAPLFEPLFEPLSEDRDGHHAPGTHTRPRRCRRPSL